MADRFVLCAGCARHVKAQDAGCPFCGASFSSASSSRPSTGEPFRRMAAAAAVAAGVAAATGCSSQSSPPSTGTFYGCACPEDATVQSDSGDFDAPSVVTFYGVANPGDAGLEQEDAPPGVDGSGDSGDASGDGSHDAPG
jgi:hypothetical protein